MATYGLGILPLIQDLRMAHRSITQTWYADDAGTGGIFIGILRHLYDLMVQGPLREYLPDPTKSILVVSLQNVPRDEAFFRGYCLYIVMVRRYLGGFAGTEASQAQ